MAGDIDLALCLVLIGYCISYSLEKCPFKSFIHFGEVLFGMMNSGIHY